MKRPQNPKRRQFLQVAVSATAAGSVIGCSRAGKRWRFLMDTEAATLGAVCDRIIPPDDWPGAVEAGALDFIDRQLTGHYAYLQQAYRQGIVELNRAAGRPFEDLSRAGQIKLLRQREQTSFFRMVREHTMQAFYGDPRHGGNRDAVSWKMLGIPNPPVRGRNRYGHKEN